jgi:hypothetical protein
MNAIPITPLTLEVARRVLWFEPPERALARPTRFIAYAMTYARHEDMRVIRRYLSDDDLREALDRAPPGIIDPRSWAYWNSKMGRYPAPPRPSRKLGIASDPKRADPTPGSFSDHAPKLSVEDLRRQGRAADTEEARRRAQQEWLAKYGPKEGN